jgi:hypothetical protein
MSLESDTQQNIQGKLDFSSLPAGEARDAGREEAESLPAVHGPESPARLVRKIDLLMQTGEVRQNPWVVMAR